MSFVEKLKFWRREEEVPEYPKVPELTPQTPQMPAGMEQMGLPRQMPGITGPPFEEQFSAPRAFAQQQLSAGMSTEQQLQLISSKLDTIKAQLETVLQRLERLERGEERPYQQRWRASI